MKTFNAQELQEILTKHKQWRYGEAGGERADLRGADLGGADLGGADLRGVRSFSGASGNCREVKAVQCDIWPVTYTIDQMQIGCQLHTLAEWWAFSDAEISRMDGQALAWWQVWKPLLKQIVETSPALPHAGTKPE